MNAEVLYHVLDDKQRKDYDELVENINEQKRIEREKKYRQSRETDSKVFQWVLVLAGFIMLIGFGGTILTFNTNFLGLCVIISFLVIMFGTILTTDM